MRKVCKVKEVKIITYFFWKWLRHNYFTSLSISLNGKLRIISIQILILYEHLLSFTKSLRALGIYASLQNAELVRKEEALYLRFFTDELKIRKLWISCCEIWETLWTKEKCQLREIQILLKSPRKRRKHRPVLHNIKKALWNMWIWNIEDLSH